MIEQILDHIATLPIDHTPDGWPAIRMCDLTALRDEIVRLRGEGRVMRDLLNLSLGIIVDCYPDDSTEAEMMQDLENQILAVLEANHE